MVELLFIMVILKLPIVYLAAVCWWAIRAEPKPLEGALRPVPAGPDGSPRRNPRRPGPRPRRGGPHGSSREPRPPRRARVEVSR